MRDYGLTPAGGAYSEITYFDVNGNVLDGAIGAVRCVIGEYTADGRLIQETWGFCGAVGGRSDNPGGAVRDG